MNKAECLHTSTMWRVDALEALRHEECQWRSGWLQGHDNVVERGVMVAKEESVAQIKAMNIEIEKIKEICVDERRVICIEIKNINENCVDERKFVCEIEEIRKEIENIKDNCIDERRSVCEIEEIRKDIEKMDKHGYCFHFPSVFFHDFDRHH